MNVVFTLDFTGAPDADDTLAARQIVFIENQRRAALQPPGTPLATNTSAAVKASYLTILLQTVTSAHLSYIAQSKSRESLSTRFSDTEVQQITQNLVTRLNNGETSAAIIADTVA
jgi:hypothetical protein